MSEVRLATLARRNGEEVRVELSEYRGAVYCHVRLWFIPKDSSEPRPGKGIALRANEIAAVASALDEAAARIDRQGRIAAPDPAGADEEIPF